MIGEVTINSVRLGAEHRANLPESGKYEAPEGHVITKVDTENGVITCKPLQMEIEMNGSLQWVTISTKDL
ncbi:hypothetical protein [Citrobacter sp. Cpo126]|uniref:hypothetical protein n=1 Tax=Citrobacter sp. Cpo126 TaxID=2985148 RepID=UPI002578BF7D|nr:hypothetical protein [Citrobacter sp. Cpo126]MDM2774974.1 hypothetical protein [Citrobacter sp. Cpo126]